MRSRFAFRNGVLTDITHEVPAPRPRAPMIITDSMPLTWHPCDGKHYDSTSAFRRVTKAYGGEEVGNDAPIPEYSPENAPAEPILRDVFDDL